jgi:ABC-type transport system involved in cytochrome c biogenesis permease subunit
MHRLGSIKVAIGLLVVVLLALAAGTIVESMRGSDAASRFVYDAPWFRILLLAFALNVLLSLVDLYPWGRHRIGFVLTHGSMLLILAGAAITLLFKVEGRLALWEGEESAVVAGSPRAGETAPPRTFALPFSVRLESFEIDYYQGTRRPAMFRSRVVVTDARGGAAFPAVIEMNHELRHAGYRLFQSSYRQEAGRDQTVLLVSRDPGEPLVFLGYGLLVAGMLTVLVTRIAQQRRSVPSKTARDGRAVRAAVAGLAVASLSLLAASSAGASTVADAGTAERLRRLPVQHDGRVMPLDTLARESVRQVTGRSAWQGADPTATVLGWVFEPEAWSALPVVRVGSTLASALGLPGSQDHASYAEMVRSQAFLSILGEAHAAEDAERPLTGVQQDAIKAEQRILTLQSFLKGEALRTQPAPGNPNAAWGTPADPHHVSGLLAVLEARPAAAHVDERAIEREVLYNRVRPSRLAWWILAPAAVASFLAWRRERRVYDLIAVGGLVAGVAVMTWGIAQRWMIASRIPASNMYESLLFLGWGVGAMALAALVVLRSRMVVLNATAMSALTMTLTDRLPIDPFIHPMPPVLSGTPWLAIHVPIIMLSYSVLALGVVVAHMQIGLLIAAPQRRDLAYRMGDLLYWYTQVGSILLIAGILTGSIWAASSWGRYWGWDPKEVWSLVAFLAYLAILHGRFDRLIGPFGVAALSIVAFWSILMTYVGVNYVLAAGLHSYGFGGSGVVRWLLLIAVAEGLFLTVGYLSVTMKQPPMRVVAP